MIAVAGVIIGVALGWISAPGTGRVLPTYEATHTLLVDPRVKDGGLVNRAALLATMGAVPDRVAARLGLTPAAVRSMVSAGTHDNEGEVLITGRSTDRGQAVALADVSAEELIAELGGSGAPIKSLEQAVAAPVRNDEVKAPPSRPGRALLLGAFGLLLGVGAALVAERFDNRIRTKATAEEALGTAVLAEVPSLAREHQDRMLSADEGSLVFEAYRGLRTGIVRAAGAGGTGQTGGRVIVVTSATGGEGKTVTVAHLAAALAEVGHSVVAVSADLRRPRLHTYFGRPLEPGLSDVLRGAPDVRGLGDLKTDTSLRGVRFVASGAPGTNPGRLFDRLGQSLAEAREMGEFVLVDVPPLLVASEAADIARLADAVLLVVRAGRTSIGAAVRSAEVLERLNIPLLGAVLVGGNQTRGRRP